MAITIRDFFRFGSNYPRLLSALFETSEAVDAVKLRALIRRHVDEDVPASETIERQLLDYGILERAPHADAAYELRPEVRDLLSWILKRQALATADVIRGYLGQLSKLTNELREAVSQRDFPAAAHPLGDLDRTLERIRAHAVGNFESIATEVQQLQSGREEMTALERFEVINRIWKRMLVPLRDLIDDRGQVEARFDQLNRLLVELSEPESTAPHSIRRRAGHTRARLARTRRALSERHDAAVREVEPLYEQLRADSMLLKGASRILERLRRRGASELGADACIVLEGWRPQGLMSDDYLEARIVALSDYEPDHKATLADPPPPVDYEPLRRDHVRSVLVAATPIEDVLQFLFERWPEYSLSELLRPFGWIHRGDFGTCVAVEGAGERRYTFGQAIVRAWPMALERVDS